MLVTVQTRGVDSTPAIREYAEEKFLTLDKFFVGITKAEVICGLESTHHQKGNIFFAEVNLDLPGKSIHVEKNAEDLYKALDKVKDHCKIELEKIKGKMHAKDKEVLREHKAYHVDDEE